MVMTGASNRQAFVGWLCKEVGIDINTVSFASAIGCVIEHRGITTTADYVNCGENLISLINEKEFAYVIFFGAMPYTSVTRHAIGNIDNERGVLRDIPGTKAKGVITYALNMIVDGEGCASCSRSVYRMLARKDVQIIAKDVAKHGTNL